MLDAEVPDHVPPPVEPRRVGRERPFHVRERFVHLVVDLDQGQGTRRQLGRLRGDDRDRLTRVADEVGGEHRLVPELEAVVRIPRHVLGAEHRVHARQRAGTGRRSIERIVANGCGLRRVAPISIRSSHRSLP